MNPQDKFLAGVVVFIVVGLAALTLTGLVQYDQDRTRFQNSQQEQKK